MYPDRLRIAIIWASFVVSAVAFFFVPGQLPAVWGVPPGPGLWVSRVFSSFFLPAVACLVWFFFRTLASRDLSPDEGGRDRARPYHVVLNAAVVFIVGLHFTLLATLLTGVDQRVGRIPPLLVGVAIIAVGNVLPRVRPNAAIGVRTPWAVGNERVWAITHRVGGYVVVGFGLTVLVATFSAATHLGWIVGLGAGATVLVLVLISYAAWRTQTTRGQQQARS